MQYQEKVAQLIMTGVVIPKWVAHKVRDWDDLFVKSPSGDLEPNPITKALINYTPIIGMSNISKDSVDEFWRRIAIHQALLGSCLVTSQNRPVFFTKSDIERHIGIETEAENLTFEEFMHNLTSVALGIEEVHLPSFVANGNCSSLEIAMPGETGVRERRDSNATEESSG